MIPPGSWPTPSHRQHTKSSLNNQASKLRNQCPPTRLILSSSSYAPRGDSCDVITTPHSAIIGCDVRTADCCSAADCDVSCCCGCGSSLSVTCSSSCSHLTTADSCYKLAAKLGNCSSNLLHFQSFFRKRKVYIHLTNIR